MPQFDADVLVAGGGPAGLAAAMYAKRAGLSVIVAEPRDAPIDKACGEGIMPGGLASLAVLEVRPDGVPFAGIAYVDSAVRVEARFRDGPGLGVRRTSLHSALVACLPDVPWMHARITDVRQDDTGVTANGVRAKWMVAADGLHSPIRRGLNVPVVSGSPKRYGLRAHWGTRRWSDFVEVWWSPWGEAYVTPVADDIVGVAVLSDLRPDLAWFPELAERLAGAAQLTAWRGAGPLRQVVARRVAGRVLLVGDAAGYEDALTGEGISLAVKQASAAINAVAADDPQRYEVAWRRITREYRFLTRGLVLATTSPRMRRMIVPLSKRLPSVFGAIVNRLAG